MKSRIFWWIPSRTVIIPVMAYLCNGNAYKLIWPKKNWSTYPLQLPMSHTGLVCYTIFYFYGIVNLPFLPNSWIWKPASPLEIVVMCELCCNILLLSLDKGCGKNRHEYMVQHEQSGGMWLTRVAREAFYRAGGEQIVFHGRGHSLGLR